MLLVLGYFLEGIRPSTTHASDGFDNTVVAPHTGPGYEYNTGADMVGPFGVFDLKRTHGIANGQVVWDLAGNLQEWTNDICYPGTDLNSWYNSGGSFIEWNNSNLNIERMRAGPDPVYTSTQNAGRYYGCNVSYAGHVLSRSGPWFRGKRVGLFFLTIDVFYTQSASYIGFRCSR